MLAEFSSILNAIQCSAKIQNQLKARNADLQEEKRLVFRFGVNSGDVVHEDDSLYSESVNITAITQKVYMPGKKRLQDTIGNGPKFRGNLD